MDDHGHGDGRLKRSGTNWNGTERTGTVRNELERSENIGHGHVTNGTVTEAGRDGHGEWSKTKDLL